MLPAPLPELVLPSRLPLDLPAEGRAALAAALEGPLPAGQRPQRGELVRESVPSRWDEEEISRLRGFLRTVDDLRGRQGRVYPLEYLLALPLIAGMAGDGELDAAAEWAATAPEDLLIRLGAPLDREGKPRRPDATTLGRALAGGCDQGQYDDALCAWSAARARALRPGMRKHLRIDGKAVRGAARGGRAPMLLSGIWDDGTTAAQLPVNVRKTNEIVCRGRRGVSAPTSNDTCAPSSSASSWPPSPTGSPWPGRTNSRTPTSSNCCYPTKSPAARTAQPPAAPAPPASTPTCAWTPGTPPPPSATTSSSGTSWSASGSPRPPTGL